MEGDFPSAVQYQQAPGVVGDFASANPRVSVLAGEGALIADTEGVLIGHFAWVDPTGQLVKNSPYAGGGAPDGFVHREQQGLIVNFLASSGYTVQPGMMVVLHDQGEFWMMNTGSSVALKGQVAYASLVDGSVTFGASGSPPGSGTSTASSIAAADGSVTGSIAINSPLNGPSTGILTVTAVDSGGVYPGSALSGTGVQSGQTVVKQLTGTANGIGTYEVSIPQTVNSTTITCVAGLLTVGGTVAGTFSVGAVISGTDVVSGTTITGLGTGSGGAGTYYVDNNTVVSSTAIDSTGAVATNYVCDSAQAQPGTLARVSSWGAG